MSDGFDRSIVESTAHRPWPMPSAPWLMTQSWNSLLFAHWRVDVAEMRRAVPDVFELDLFDGEAWLGVVPFHMTNVGLRAAPALPWLSAFPELNVRTYVRVSDRPGVYFFSLDAGRRLAVAAARALLNLPYYTAVMSVEHRDAAVHYRQCTAKRRCGLQRRLRTRKCALRSLHGIARVLSDGAVLPVSLRPPRTPLSPRDSPPAVVPPDRTRDDHYEHDGRGQSPDTQRRTQRCCTSHGGRTWSPGPRRVCPTAVIEACGTSPSNAGRQLAGCDVHTPSATRAS